MVVSTYQAASGAGQAAMEELEQQTREVLDGAPGGGVEGGQGPAERAQPGTTRVAACLLAAGRRRRALARLPDAAPGAVPPPGARPWARAWQPRLCPPHLHPAPRPHPPCTHSTAAALHSSPPSSTRPPRAQASR